MSKIFNLGTRFFKETGRQSKLAKRIVVARPKREACKKELADTRALLRGNTNVSNEEANELQMKALKLQARLDKSSRVSVVKYRKICGLTNRSTGVCRGIQRGMFRHHVSCGNLVGFVKG